MKKLILLLLIVSCSKDGSNRLNFQKNLFEKWVASVDIALNKISLDKDLWITRPYNTWIQVAYFKYLDKDNYHLRKDCLFYKTPRRYKNEGIIKIVQIEEKKNCELKDLENVSIEMKVSGLKLIMAKEFSIDVSSYGRLDKNHLLLQYKNATEFSHVESLVIPLINLNYKNNKFDELIQANRFRSSLSANMKPGLLIHSMGSSKPVKVKNKIKWLGKIGDSFSDRTAVFCEQYSKDCKLKNKTNCDQCLNGWYEVGGGLCPSKNNKVCGINSCGKKNELACPRGNTYDTTDNGYPCVNNSTAGFCERGLVPNCVEKKYLVCL